MADSLSSLSTEELIDRIESLGIAYAAYSEKLRSDGVNGELWADYMSRGELDELLNDLSIVNRVHRRRLSLLGASSPSLLNRSNSEPGLVPPQDTLIKMVTDVPTMVFGDTQVYRDGLSGRLGELTRSVRQEFEQNEGGKWLPELEYVLGRASERYGGPPKGKAPSDDLIPVYTRDLWHDGWSVQRFWEAQPDQLRGARSWTDRGSPGGNPNELTELEVVILRCWTGPVFKSWNFFLRYGPGVVLCCTGQPYHEHHKNNLVFCPKSKEEPDVCAGCGKLRVEHSEQRLASWGTCISILYSGITKVSTASKPATVYRGVNEKRIKLPRSFSEALAGDFAGGVELAAMATTTERKVAEVFSGDEQGSIFEITFNSASRGADLQFLSQFPAEREFLYPPGTALTCEGVRSEGGKRVLKLQATYNPDTLLMKRAAAVRSLDHVPRDDGDDRASRRGSEAESRQAGADLKDEGGPDSATEHLQKETRAAQNATVREAASGTSQDTASEVGATTSVQEEEPESRRASHLLPWRHGRLARIKGLCLRFRSLIVCLTAPFYETVGPIRLILCACGPLLSYDVASPEYGMSLLFSLLVQIILSWLFDRRGNTPFEAAIINQDPAEVEALLKAGADPNRLITAGAFGIFFSVPPLATAALQNVAIVKALLKAGADPNRPSTKGPFGMLSSDPPLFLAASGLYLPAVQALLAAGADPNQLAVARGLRGVTRTSPLDAVVTHLMVLSIQRLATGDLRADGQAPDAGMLVSARKMIATFPRMRSGIFDSPQSCKDKMTLATLVLTALSEAGARPHVHNTDPRVYRMIEQATTFVREGRTL